MKGYFDEDDEMTLDPVQVRAGVEREMAFMGELGVGEPCDRPKTEKVWSTRCYRRKGDAVRSRLVVRQFSEAERSQQMRTYELSRQYVRKVSLQ